MKKLLGITLLGLFICNLSYANTPVQQYVFEKLYDEYSQCTVYYKFLSRGVERKKDIAALTEKEELFVKQMNILSEEAEKNMYFFSSKINVPNENIQSNIQNIYKTFLDIAGRDYSKTELLNDKYFTLCSKSLEDPKSRMVYWDTEFQKSKNNDQTLNNKILTCAYFNDWNRENIVFGIYFNSDRLASIFHIRDFKLIEAKYNLKVEINEIRFVLDKNDIDKYEDNDLPEWFNLKRNTLGFSYKYKIKLGNDYDLQIISCELSDIDSFLALKEFMNSTFQKKIKDQKKQNKI